MLSHNAVNTAPHIAALDSGCTHHTLKRSLFPDSVPIDTTQVVDIQTAHSGTSIKSSGRASAGVLKDAIVVMQSCSKNIESCKNSKCQFYICSFRLVRQSSYTSNFQKSCQSSTFKTFSYQIFLLSGGGK